MADSEVERTLNFLATAGPLASTAVPNAVADEIMLSSGGQVLSRGTLYLINCAKMSPGVCRLTLQDFYNAQK